MTDSKIDIDPTARDLIVSSAVWDMTVPWSPEDRNWDLDILRRFHREGFSFVSLTLTDWPATYEGTIGTIHRFKELVAAEAADWLCLASSVSEIDRARQTGRLALGIHIQETLPVAMDLSRLATLHALGVRHMLLAYNIRNFVADGCAEVANAGLSNFGRKLVREMNRIGMVVDCSHSGRRSSLEAMEISGRPPIFSHSGVYNLVPHIRNIHDDQIRACAAKDGVIGVVGVGSFLGDMEARTESWFRHIDYLVSMVGPEHVGLATDNVASRELRDAIAKDAYQKYGIISWPEPEIGWPNPTGTQLPGGSAGIQPEQLSELVETMLGHGYPASAVVGILGANFRRVYAAAE